MTKENINVPELDTDVTIYDSKIFCAVGDF